LSRAVARITRDAIDPAAASAMVARPGAGAVLTFAGVVRDRNLGRTVEAIEYHGYEEMALQEMARIEEEARRRWPAVAVEIVHRLGALSVGETSVLIAVSSPHRAEGFLALRFAIDTLKETVPIWKKEIYADGYAWIEGS
jgi:molybdopterin synthase catalytic subunit